MLKSVVWFGVLAHLAHATTHPTSSALPKKTTATSCQESHTVSDFSRPVKGCPTLTVSHLASALSGNDDASSICKSAYPQSPYETTTEYNSDASFIASLTTTSITCTPNSKRVIAQTTSIKKNSSVIHKASAVSRTNSSRPTIISKPTTNANPLVQSLKKLPQTCFSSVCSSLAGTRTFARYTATSYHVAATVYVAKPETCGPNDFCDTIHDKPVCRPRPEVNACAPIQITNFANPQLALCTSTNGCTGGCWYLQLPGPAANYSNGNCALSNPFAFTANDVETPCNVNSDCGRGEVCGQQKFGRVCRIAASETCNSPLTPDTFLRL